MKERPILFNAEMVQAILSGRKTQTRHIIKPNKWEKEYWEKAEQLINAGTHYAEFAYRTTTHKRAEQENNFIVRHEQVKAGTTAMANDTLLHQDYEAPPIYCPLGQAGDHLWVRESWSTHACFNDISSKYLSDCRSIHYWADGDCETGKKRPSTQMPRWASRILLEITKIRVERLNDISESDCLKEGIVDGCCLRCRFEACRCKDRKPDLIQGFAREWSSVNGFFPNGGKAWRDNPWVWVVEFKVIEGARA